MTLDPTDQLRFAVDEYRFQVRLNADRINYWYTLNVALLVAAAALTASSHVPEWVSALTFAVSAVTSALCALAVHVQHSYYRAARDRMSDCAAAVGVPDLLRTTPGMRRETAVRVRVASVVETLFALMALVAVAAAVGVLVD